MEVIKTKELVLPRCGLKLCGASSRKCRSTTQRLKLGEMRLASIMSRRTRPATFELVRDAKPGKSARFIVLGPNENSFSGERARAVVATMERLGRRPKPTVPLSIIQR